ncbi:MAG: DsbA family protein [Gaiellaceae bacterium]
MLAFVVAAVIAAALVAVSLLGSSTGDDDQATSRPIAAVVERDALFRGIPQDGISLGSPQAPVTLVEYADIQCTYCAQWSRDAFPTIVEEYVRAGRVRVVFRGLAFVGLQSEKALRATLAAGEQDRLWDVLHGLFVRQGAENAGWVSDSLLRSFGGTGLDAELMLASTESPWVERQLTEARQAAQRAGIPGTPSFQAGRTGGALAPLRVNALDADTFVRELDRLLAE